MIDLLAGLPYQADYRSLHKGLQPLRVYSLQPEAMTRSEAFMRPQRRPGALAKKMAAKGKETCLASRVALVPAAAQADIHPAVRAGAVHVRDASPTGVAEHAVASARLLLRLLALGQLQSNRCTSVTAQIMWRTLLPDLRHAHAAQGE